MKKPVAILLYLLGCQVLAWAQTPHFTVQVASAPTPSGAQLLVEQLTAAGLPAYWIGAEVPGQGARYRVRFGQFPSRAVAKAEAEQARQRQLIQAYLVTAYERPAAFPATLQTLSFALQPAVAVKTPASPRSPSPPLKQTPTQATSPAGPPASLSVGLSEPLVRPIPARSAGLDAGRVVHWTLRDAMLAALEKNVDIELERGNVRLAQYDVLAAEGVYDRVSIGGVSYESATLANTRLFSGTNATTTDSRTLNFSHGLRQQLQRGGGSYQLDFDNARNSNNFGTLSPQYNPQLSFTFTQPLFRNFKLDPFRRQIKVAKKRRDLSDAIFRQRVIEIISQTQRAYWNLVLARKNEEIQRDAAKLAEQQLRLNQRQAELGTQSELEVVQSASALEMRRQQVFQAMETEIQAENALKLLTVEAAGDELARAQILPVESFTARALTLPLEDALKLAKQYRPELKQLVLLQESNRIDQDFFHNQLKPQIDLVGRYALIGVAGSKNSGLVTPTPTCVTTNPPDTPGCIPAALIGGYPAALGNLFKNDFRSWQVGVNISLPWRNSVNKANLGRAKEQERQLDLQTRRELRNIELEVRQALQAIETIKLRLDAAHTAVEYTKQQLDGEQKKFAAGLSTTFLVLQRQDELTRARGGELQALADYNQAVASLQRVMATTLSDNGIEIHTGLEKRER